MHLVNIIGIIAFSCLVGHSNLTISISILFSGFLGHPVQGESKKTDTFDIQMNNKGVSFFWLTLYIYYFYGFYASLIREIRLSNYYTILNRLRLIWIWKGIHFFDTPRIRPVSNSNFIWYPNVYMEHWFSSHYPPLQHILIQKNCDLTDFAQRQIDQDD
jgi:hypothetical protein